MERKENYDSDFDVLEFFYPAGVEYEEMIEEIIPRKEAVQAAAGDAIGEIYGVLGLRGAFHEVIPADADPARAVSVHLGKDGAKIEACVIADIGWDAADLVSELAENVTEAVRAETGTDVKEVVIEVADSMPREEFEDKYCGGILH